MKAQSGSFDIASSQGATLGEYGSGAPDSQGAASALAAAVEKSYASAAGGVASGVGDGESVFVVFHVRRKKRLVTVLSIHVRCSVPFVWATAPSLSFVLFHTKGSLTCRFMFCLCVLAHAHLKIARGTKKMAQVHHNEMNRTPSQR